MDPRWSLNKTRNIADEFSTAELLLDKNQIGPPFVIRETDSAFILTSNLKGYRRENIKVKINKAGKRVAIFGEKPVQEAVMVGNNVYKTETKMISFEKAFRFTDGVILDKIKAMFNEQEYLLTISVPKMARRGFRVTRIEELKHVEIGTNYESLQIEKDAVDEIKTSKNEKYRKEKVEVQERDKYVVKVDKEEALARSEVVQKIDNPQVGATENLEVQELEAKQVDINPNKAQNVHETGKIQELDNLQIDAMENLDDQELEAKQERIDINPNEGQHVQETGRIQELDNPEIDVMKNLNDEELEAKQESIDISPNKAQHVRETGRIQELDNPGIDAMKNLDDQKLETKQERIDIDPNEAHHVQEPDQTQTDSMKDFSFRESENEEEEKRMENEGEEVERDECPKRKKSKCKLCDPMILGSTILVTIFGLIIYLVRNQNPHRKKKN